MIKKPFNKIRKIERKEEPENSQETNARQEAMQAPRQIVSKTPIFNLQKKNPSSIYDALKKTQQDSKEITEPKPALNSRPQLLKPRKDSKVLNFSNKPPTSSNQIPQDSYNQAPKPTPLIIKKKHNLGLGMGREKEHVIVEEDQSKNQIENGYQRFQDSQEDKIDQSYNKKPDMKIKRLMDKNKKSERQKFEDNVDSYRAANQQSPTEQQTFIPVRMEQQKINLQQTTPSISQEKLSKQAARTKDLANLLNLQSDIYDQIISINSVTSYEIYINKIKSGFLKNSNDQSFDDKTVSSCQTLSFDFADFSNQCPQDYQDTGYAKVDKNEQFQKFILSVAPVIQELIKPSTRISTPPIFLLAFRPVFKKFIKCPYPVFIYHSEEFKLDLLIIGQKLYITEGEIVSVLSINNKIIGGLADGNLVLWNGVNNKGSKIYQKIREITQSTNFQLPSYTTHDFQRYSIYASDVLIVSLIHQIREEFSSLDSNGKLIRWKIDTSLNKLSVLSPISVIQFANITKHPSLIVFGLKKRNEDYFINTSIGLLYWCDHEIAQKIDIQGVNIVDFELPKRSKLIYAISQDNTLKIYNQIYSKKIFELSLSMLGGEEIVEIIVPELEHDNREISILYVVYVADKNGKIYQLKLLQNKVEYVNCLKSQHQNEEKNVIYNGVNRVGDKIEVVRLMRDLKCSSLMLKMAVSTDKTVQNLKSIIEKNKEMVMQLQKQNLLIC